MAVRPESLENPERGMGLLNRKVDVDPDEEVGEDGTRVLEVRLEAARRIPPEEGVPCRACWQAGRDAAIRAFEGVTTQTAGVSVARALQPAGPHWLDAWRRGRDAALRAIEGK